MTIRSGTRLERYEIRGLVGAGGMGEVYRAHDERLGRDVAVKVLPPEVADDPDRLARFQREARALARLSHPNILAIHDFGTDGTVAYAVTELLEGDTLRQRIERERLPWRRAVEIAAAIADGLAAAHARGIVHRDLKPENVFLTADGVVKILDFGLARLEEDALAGGDTLTSPPPGTVVGTVLGTLGTMAPEQVRGEAADARSDIFALGCVLFEMLAGRPAFRRASAAETTAAILKEPAPDLTAPTGEVAPELALVVRHCLEKEPGERFQSAKDAAFALRALLSAPVPVSAPIPRPRRRLRPMLAGAGLAAAAAALLLWAPWHPPPDEAGPEPGRVAVAAFDNLTGDPSLDPLGRMAAERITQGLSEVEGVEAVPTTAGTSSQEDPVVALAERTGAGTVVSGAYYLQGGELQLQARITDGARGTLVYAVEPVAAPPDGATEAIEVLRQRIMGAVFYYLQPNRSLDLTRPSRYDAFREYSAGVDLFGSDYPAAIRHFERAAEIDPEFTAAQVWVATSLINQRRYAEAAAVARRLNEDRERMTSYERDQLDWLRALLAGRNMEALQAARRSAARAPDSSVRVYIVGLMALAANRPQETVDTFTRYAREHPDEEDAGRIGFSWWFTVLARAQHMLGNYEAELATADAAVEAFPDSLAVRGARVRALIALDRLAEADRELDDCLTVQARSGTVPSLMLSSAMEMGAHGHRDLRRDLAERAVQWLRGRPPAEKAGDVHLIHLAWALGIAGRWDEARTASETIAHRYPLDREPSATADSTDTVSDTVKRMRAVDAAGSLGVLAARRGDRAEALRISHRLAAVDATYLYGNHTYWRACIAAQLGDTDGALALLRQAIAEGTDFGVSFHRDPDLEPLWGDPGFRDLLRPRG